MTASEIVTYLDSHVIGQSDAKRAVANALRNRWRRRQLSADLQRDIKPMNILMIGPTGVGKTEIARRLALWSNSPFVKVEASRYTEVGFVGRDVDTIISDLFDAAMSRERTRLEAQVANDAQIEVDNRIVDILTGKVSTPQEKAVCLNHLQAGLLDKRRITIPIEPLDDPEIETIDLEAIFREFKKEDKYTDGQLKTTVKLARERMLRETVSRSLSLDKVILSAIQRVEQEGIVFIDEIDKICAAPNSYHSGASDVGVQKDLLPIIEGTEVTVTYKKVEYKIKTDHILFICAGAFHSSKPSDLISELQGRLPVRVQLSPLSETDLRRILTEPKNNLLIQQAALLSTEGVKVTFPPDTVDALIKAAANLNATVANLGARRLQTVVDRVMEKISFDAAEGSDVTVTPEEVAAAVSSVSIGSTDLYKYIL